MMLMIALLFGDEEESECIYIFFVILIGLHGMTVKVFAVAE